MSDLQQPELVHPFPNDEEEAGDNSPAGEGEAIDFGPQVVGPIDLGALAVQPGGLPANMPPGANALSDFRVLQATATFAETWAAILAGWMARNLRPGRDYGKIKGKTKNDVEFTGKPTLLKPGAERITLALGLRVRFVRDRQTHEMAGSIPGLIAYKCYLLDGAGAIVGEGRGACGKDEKPTINTCIKIAEKRAHMDAVLRIAGLSAFFVQDEDEAEETRPPRQQAAGPRQRPQAANQNHNAGNSAPGASNRRPQNPDRAATLAVFRQRFPLATDQELGGLIAEWMQQHIRPTARGENIGPDDWARAREILGANPTQGAPASPPRRSTRDVAAEIFS